MARITIKATYSLDPDTVRALEGLAHRWDVYKSEALRRAICAAARDAEEDRDALSALDRLQQSLRVSETSAEKWVAEVRGERRASGRRRDTN